MPASITVNPVTPSPSSIAEVVAPSITTIVAQNPYDTAAVPPSQTHWESPEAVKYFGYHNQRMMERLRFLWEQL